MKTNPLKKIISKEPVPETLKPKVLSSVKKVQLLMDLSDLFALKSKEAFQDMLDLKKKDKKSDF